jgi:cytochrome c nitrite reductase small subunit
MNRLAIIGGGLALALGAAAGLAGYTFIYAKGASYLTNDPAACANCHIMRDHFDAWRKSSHHAVATCNDCHTPSGFVGKYTTKALNGFWHSFYFTTGNFPDPLRITPRNRAITERKCRECHAGIVDMIEGTHRDAEDESCIRCHRLVGHPLR